MLAGGIKGHASAEVGSKFTLTDNIYITGVVGDDTVSVLVSFGQTGSGPLDGLRLSRKCGG